MKVPARGNPLYRIADGDPWEWKDLELERAARIAAESAEERAYREFLERMDEED